MPESLADRTKRCARIIQAIEKAYPDARCSLNFTNPLELLVATILSAQCTDVRVNLVTPELFRKYPTAAALAAASQEAIEQAIRTTGFFRNKAKSLRLAAAKIVSDFGGKVPSTMDELLTLGGVARKTANVVLGNAFGKSEGVVVDTHVTRVAGRLKLTANTVPPKIELDLMKIVPKTKWTLFAHLMIFHGRAVCTARNPNCEGCPINKLCPSAFKV